MDHAEMWLLCRDVEKTLNLTWDSQRLAQQRMDVAERVLADATRERDNAVTAVRRVFARKVSLLESLLTKTGET